MAANKKSDSVQVDNQSQNDNLEIIELYDENVTKYSSISAMHNLTENHVNSLTNESNVNNFTNEQNDYSVPKLLVNEEIDATVLDSVNVHVSPEISEPCDESENELDIEKRLHWPR